jgi:hypothetical protein
MRGLCFHFVFWALVTTGVRAAADCLIIIEQPLDLEVIPDEDLSSLRSLSLKPPMAAEPEDPRKEDPVFLKKQPSGELAIDVPTAETLQAQSKRKVNHFEASQFTPSDLDSSADQTRLGVRLMSHAIQETLQSETDTSMAEAGTAANNDAKKTDDATAAKSPPPVKTNPGVLDAELPWFEAAGVSHQFGLQMRAADSTEALVYRGLADASLQYQNEQKAVGVEFKHKLLLGMDLIYGYTTSSIENRNQLKLSWNF